MLTKREWLIDLAEKCGIAVLETIPPDASNDGLYFTYHGSHIILMKKSLPDREYIPVLAEEIGHCVATHGIVIEQCDVALVKSERYGRDWAIEFLLPLCKFAFASILHGCVTEGEYAEVFDIHVDFVASAIAYYQRKGCWPKSFKAMYRMLLNTKYAESDSLAI